MNNFSWAKALGFGVLIWVAMFILSSIVVAFGATIGVFWGLTLAVLVGALSYVFAINAKASNGLYALAYGAVWAAIGVVLDYLITTQFQANIYGMWTYWVGYALMLFAPWVEYEIQGAGAHPKPV